MGYRSTSGSGNKLGDGDVKSRSIQTGKLQFGFECKDRSKQEHHGMSTADWKKAKRQILSSGFDPVFVTRNSKGEIVAHIQWGVLIELMERAAKVDVASI